jgi:hypothetical protein
VFLEGNSACYSPCNSYAGVVIRIVGQYLLCGSVKQPIITGRSRYGKHAHQCASVSYDVGSERSSRILRVEELRQKAVRQVRCLPK